MSVLDGHLQPDERVIYRTRHGWKAVPWLLFQSLFIATWVLILYWAIDYDGPSELDEYEDIILAVVILGPVTYYALRDYSRIALVTKQRLLKKTGVFNPEIEEMAHADVKRLSMSWAGWPRIVTVHGRNGKEIDVCAPLEPDALCRAIGECAQVSAPAKRGARIIAAGVVQTVLVYVGPIVTASIVFNLLWILLDYQLEIDDRLMQIILGLVWCALFIPAVFSLHVGLYFGNLLSMIFLRPILSAPEAKRFFAAKWRDRADEDPDSMARLIRDTVRFGLSLKQKLLSRLYGEPIRLDD